MSTTANRVGALLRPTAQQGGVMAARIIPGVLAVTAIALQIAYPLVQAGVRDVVTIMTVVSFGAASLSHAWVEHGGRTAAWIAVVFAGGGLAVEVLGVSTGVPFGEYAYDDRLGPMVGEVPVIIPLAWCMLGYPALVLARLTARSRVVGTVVGAGALTAWDLFLDPQMVAEGYWTWSAAGPHLIDTVPATNYVAWVVTAWVMMMAVWHLTSRWSPATRDLRVPVVLYLWTWVGSTLSHAAFFDLPRSALYGGIGMGLFVVSMAVSMAVSANRPSMGGALGGAAVAPERDDPAGRSR